MRRFFVGRYFLTIKYFYADLTLIHFFLNFKLAPAENDDISPASKRLRRRSMTTQTQTNVRIAVPAADRPQGLILQRGAACGPAGVNMNVHFVGDLIAKSGMVYNFVSVGGSIDASGADTKTAFPRLQSVGGSIYASGADTKTAFPRLQSVGGSIYANEDFKHVEIGNSSRCHAMLLQSFSKNGYSFADNMLAKVVSVKGRVSRVILAGKTQVSYLVTDGAAWSHGETLKAAREGLMFKISSRDTTEFKNWKLDTKVTLSQAIKSYRAITGTCEQGIRSWLENRKVPESMTIAQAIEITGGAYGANTYKAFFA